MKIISTIIGLTLVALLSAGVWVLRYHPDWLQSAEVAAEEDEDVDPQKLEIPVHVGKVVRATLHRYIDVLGVVEPAPPRVGRMSGTADVAAPVAGVIGEVLCEAGQQVKKGDPLVQLDDRLAVAGEKQAAAALAEANASLAKLLATPRPEQVEVAKRTIEKAGSAVNFAQKNLARQQELAKDQGVSAKIVEQAEMDLTTARNERGVAESELALLTPAPQELAAEQAKVAAAEAALAVARAQREMLRIVAPIDATVIAVAGNPGEAVDATKVLVDLVALDRLVVNLSIPVDESPSLINGMSVQVFSNLSAKSDESSQGKIYFIGSEVDRKTNTIPIGVDVPASLAARPGQTIRARIVAEEHKDCLAVPRESVVADENGDNFIALIDGDQATHKIVHTGLREGNLIEIDADGIKQGDTIATWGAFGLAKFQVAKVKVAEK